MRQSRSKTPHQNGPRTFTRVRNSIHTYESYADNQAQGPLFDPNSSGGKRRSVPAIKEQTSLNQMTEDDNESYLPKQI
jgi:hypothetical protein